MIVTKYPKLYYILLFTICAIFLRNFNNFFKSPLIDSKQSKGPMDGYMTDVTAVYYNELGEQQYILSTPKLTHYELNNRTHFLKPFILLKEKNPKSPWIFKASHGEALNGSTSLTLWDKVQILQSQSAHNPDTEILTDRITYFPDQKLATTDYPIVLKQSAGQIHSHGLRANFKENLFELLSKARGNYENRS